MASHQVALNTALHAEHCKAWRKVGAIAALLREADILFIFRLFQLMNNLLSYSKVIYLPCLNIASIATAHHPVCVARVLPASRGLLVQAFRTVHMLWYVNTFFEFIALDVHGDRQLSLHLTRFYSCLKACTI